MVPELPSMLSMCKCFLYFQSIHLMYTRKQICCTSSPPSFGNFSTGLSSFWELVIYMGLNMFEIVERLVVERIFLIAKHFRVLLTLGESTTILN